MTPGRGVVREGKHEMSNESRSPLGSTVGSLSNTSESSEMPAEESKVDDEEFFEMYRDEEWNSS